MGNSRKGLSDETKKGGFRRLVDRAVQFYQTYTSGLKSGDFKKLFTQETRGIYSHFDRERRETGKEEGVKGVFRTIGRIFWGFLLALNPARRILYGIAFLIFLASAFVALTAPYDSAIRQDVTTISIYSFIIVSFLLALELADKLSARDEIEIAREVQMSLLPPDDPNLPGLEISSFSAPAADVGGDYYDFASVNGRTCLALGDVSGHGMGAGLVMAMAKSAWQAQLINSTEPTAVLATLNRIVGDAGGNRTLMTFLHCVLEHEDHQLVFANAGHIYPMHYRPSNRRIAWLETPSAYPLGVRAAQKYTAQTVDLEVGDMLFFISDGMVEVVNPEGESFGYHRFEEAVRNNGNGSPAAAIEGILGEVQGFAQDAPRQDDLTIIVARYRAA